MRRSIVGMLLVVLALSLIAPLTDGLFGRWSPVSDASAIVGRPLTPLSIAGVARRTTRRAIYRTAIYVATLPPACTVVVVEGTRLYACGGRYYQAVGTQYVVVNVN